MTLPTSVVIALAVKMVPMRELLQAMSGCVPFRVEVFCRVFVLFVLIALGPDLC